LSRAINDTGRSPGDRSAKRIEAGLPAASEQELGPMIPSQLSFPNACKYYRVHLSNQLAKVRRILGRILEPMHRGPQDASDLKRRELERRLFPDQRFQHFRQQTFKIGGSFSGHLGGEFIAAFEEIACVRRGIHQVERTHGPHLECERDLATKNALGWDMTFATNHLGPFALTEALVPHLPDGTNVVFIASAVEDPERKPAVAFGFRGGRYISAEASARGEWKPDGSTLPGADAYATSKQCNLATAMAFARETPRLHFNAVEPGVTPATGLGRDAGAFVRFLSKYTIPLLVPLLMPFIRILSTPKRAARVITKILTDASGQTGIYYDEGGQPMLGSALVRDPQFQDRVVAETRALLSTIPR
jgi:NAD(P)-dependent dehydrogenase (short-subunit alcohol dehydrogenase family)